MSGLAICRRVVQETSARAWEPAVVSDGQLSCKEGQSPHRIPMLQIAQDCLVRRLRNLGVAIPATYF